MTTSFISSFLLLQANHLMKNLVVSTALLFFITVGTFAQASAPAASVPVNFAAEKSLAQSAYAALGGDKFRNATSIVVRGSVDITMSAFPQAIPGGFSMVISGEKYRLDMTNAMQSFKQVFDGQQTLSSVSGFTLPPLTSMGLPLLQRLGTAGYEVSAIPTGGKKKNGFRLSSPDGSYTDFFVDPKTSQIAGYESIFDVRGNSVKTSVEIDKYLVVDGVAVPEKYAQRFDLGQLTAYASFKAKEIVVNKPVDADVFVLGK